MSFRDWIKQELEAIEEAGLYKRERAIASLQGAHICLQDGRELINLCANNYLGYSGDAEVIAAAHKALDARGYGLSSVRFICGTQDIHKALEAEIADFLQTEDAILFPSCFDANAGIFECFLGAEDAIISDALNHASIIDGVRLCKAARYRYANRDMQELETALKAASSARFRLVVTDGVFSMDGHIAPLDEIRALCRQYDALLMVDDSHSTGVLGETGRGTAEHFGLLGEVDFVTSTLGKALGGASGGFIAASADAVALLRQRARPYLFSNAVAPMIVEATRFVLSDLQEHPERVAKLRKNGRDFRAILGDAGFELLPGETPIVPVMLRDPKLAQEMARCLDDLGVYVAAFSFPVVPRGQDRIRTQLSAAHSAADIQKAADAFIAAGQKLGVLS